MALGGAEAFIGEETTVIDLDGRLVLPGFHDDRIDLKAGADWLRIRNDETGASGLRPVVAYLHRFGITSIRRVDEGGTSESLGLRLVEGDEAERRFGSGWPQATADPLVAIHRAVTGRNLDGRLVSRERIPVASALREHTRTPLRVGGLADLVVVQDDLLKIPPDRLAESKVEMTILGGTIVYESVTFDHRGRATLQ